MIYPRLPPAFARDSDMQKRMSFLLPPTNQPKGRKQDDMNKKELIDEIKALNATEEKLKEQIFDLHELQTQKRKELANLFGWEAYGLKVGDKIQFEKRTLRKTETITIIIDAFSIWFKNFEEDTEPTIRGTRVLKDGSIGSKEESWYSVRQDGEFVKVS